MAGGQRETHGCVFQGRKTRGVATNVYLRKMLEKSKLGLRILRTKVRELFTCGEDISTPRVHHKRQQPLIKSAKLWLQFYFISPFLCSYVFLCLLYFLYFCGRQGCFPRSYVSSIAMRKSDLRSSFRTKCWLSCFDLFPQDQF